MTPYRGRSRGPRVRLGRKGEEFACRYLEAQGYRILARNHRTPYGELDIVAREGETLVFVEVRLRRPGLMGTPQESLRGAKRRRLIASAQHYLQETGWQGPWRIDLVAVHADAHGRPAQVEHIPSAVEGEDPSTP